jgi:hypothetical protein
VTFIGFAIYTLIVFGLGMACATSLWLITTKHRSIKGKS